MTKFYLTFSPKETIETNIEKIKQHYSILYNKIFILESPQHDSEYFITFNLDPINISSIEKNMISIHRNKENNVIYTINSLNELIKIKNNGVLKKGFEVNWGEYKNSLILTNNNQLKILNTNIYKIITL